MSYWRTLKDPTLYHGHKKTHKFFEGWYFKLISADGSARQAVIPGIFKHQDPAEAHAFIQVMDGIAGTATYHRFDADDFWASESEFDVRIGDNHFRADCLSLNIENDTQHIVGEISLNDITPYPVTRWNPGIMGPFGYLPFLETNHGVVSVDHALDGVLTIDGEALDFTGGRGYTEKDWGESFPSGYVWVQTNHFNAPNTSLMISIAMIPRLGRTFRGFLSAFYHQGELYRFATYTGASIKNLVLTDTHVSWHMTGRTNGAKHRVEIDAKRAKGGLLKAPYEGQMLERVAESLDAEVTVKLWRLEGNDQRLVFDDIGIYAGLEVEGDLSPLLDKDLRK